MGKVLRVVGAATLVIAGLSACSSSKSKVATNATTATTVAPQPTKILITAKEDSPTKYSFDVPAAFKAGLVDMSLTNTGKQPHDFQLVRLDPGITDAQLQKEFIDTFEQDGAPIPAWVHGAGGLTTTAPGKVAITSGKLAKGDYIYFCTESDDGSDPAVPKGSHLKKGMYARISITEDGAPGDLPATPATIGAHEYAFDVSGLKAGTNQVTFKNTGTQLHHFLALPIAAGKTIDDVKAAFNSNDQNAQPPVDFEKAVGAAVVDPGESAVYTVDLTPGKYALVCFLTDRAGGPPHMAKGMLQEVVIT